MIRFWHAIVAAASIIRGRGHFVAMVKSTGPDGIMYHALCRLPDSKVVRETFLVSAASDITAMLAESATQADFDIEDMIQNAERPA